MRAEDLAQVFSIQTERTVAQDNTVAIRDRHWQLDRSPFRRTLTGCTVTICEHLDHIVTIRWGPHQLGSFDAAGQPLERKQPKRRGKAGTHSPLEISQITRDSPFSTAPTTTVLVPKRKNKTKAARAA